MSTSYSASASVFDSRSRMAASSSTTSTRGRPAPGAPAQDAGPPGSWRRRATRAAAATRATRRCRACGSATAVRRRTAGIFPGLDQPIDRPQVDLKVLRVPPRWSESFPRS
jgi:hypothetical protein